VPSLTELGRASFVISSNSIDMTSSRLGGSSPVVVTSAQR